jgi:hypothetical protein
MANHEELARAHEQIAEGHRAAAAASRASEPAVAPAPRNTVTFTVPVRANERMAALGEAHRIVIAGRHGSFSGEFTRG